MTRNIVHLHLREIRNARTEKQTKEAWDTYLKQREERKEIGKKHGKKHNKKDSKK